MEEARMSCSCPMPRGGSHCAACHVTFSGVRAFDMHQRMAGGKSVCRPPQDVGLVIGRHFGPDDTPVWGRPGPQIRPAAWGKPAAQT